MDYYGFANKFNGCGTRAVQRCMARQIKLSLKVCGLVQAGLFVGYRHRLEQFQACYGGSTFESS